MDDRATSSQTTRTRQGLIRFLDFIAALVAADIGDQQLTQEAEQCGEANMKSKAESQQTRPADNSK